MTKAIILLATVALIVAAVLAFNAPESARPWILALLLVGGSGNLIWFLIATDRAWKRIHSEERRKERVA